MPNSEDEPNDCLSWTKPRPDILLTSSWAQNYSEYQFIDPNGYIDKWGAVVP